MKVGDLLAGKYRVERLLGEGGMGIVVEAHHELLDQRVAVKLLYQELADREAQTRLLQEARSAAKLQSEHVARVIDVDVGPDGLPFIVMELLEGMDLCAVADTRGALPPWLVVDYILQALEGLAFAHGRQIIHRDLKPSNLFLSDRADGTQVIKILDFGISKSQDPPDRRAQQLTGGRTVLGSPPYMSPEQVRSPKTVDLRTDIWSLGICMYELLTNSMPFGGDELQETFAQILEKQPTPLRNLVPGIEGLDEVVMKCLAKNREERFADVSELASALVPFGSGAWAQSAERVQATLARALMEDLSSGLHMRKGPTSERIPPSGRRLESLQPELTGTASTVAMRYSGFESKKLWVIGLSVGLGCAGLMLIAASTYTPLRRSFGSPPEPDFTHAPGEAPVAVDPPPLPTPVQTGVEGDLPNPQTAGTLLGASPVPVPTEAPKPKPVSSLMATSPPKKSSPTPSVKVAPPAGLPMTRSGN